MIIFLFLDHTRIRVAVVTVVLILANIFNESAAQDVKNHLGIVLSSDTTLLLSDIEVKNLNSEIRTTSDYYGRFTIQYKLGDTVEFKHRDWERKLLIAPNLRDSIFLTKKGIVLNEVVIMANRTNSRLRDLEKLEADLNKKNGIYYNGRPPLGLLNPFGGKPITYFYELLSKGGRRARKMKSTIQSEYERSEVDKIFNTSTIRAVIDIDESSIERFIEQFRPTLKEANSWTVYDFQVYVKKSYKSFSRRL